MAFEIASGFNIGKLIGDAGRLPDGNFSFDQLDKITSGKYNVGLLKLGDGGKLVKFNNHVWRTGANDEKVTVAENIAVRNAVYRAIETRCEDFANSDFTKFLDTVRQELVGEARMHLPLSRNEVRAMLNQLKALSAGDSVKRLEADIGKLDARIGELELQVKGMEQVVEAAQKMVPAYQKFLTETTEYKKLVRDLEAHNCDQNTTAEWKRSLNDLKAAQEGLGRVKSLSDIFGYEQNKKLGYILKREGEFAQFIGADLMNHIRYGEKLNKTATFSELPKFSPEWNIIKHIETTLGAKEKAAESALDQARQKVEDLRRQNPDFDKFRAKLELEQNFTDDSSLVRKAAGLRMEMGKVGFKSKALDDWALRGVGLVDLDTAKQFGKELSSLKGTLESLRQARVKAESRLLTEKVKLASAFAPEKFLAAIQRHQPETMRKEFLWDLFLRYGKYENCRPILSKIRTMLLRDDVWDSKDFDTWKIQDFPSSHFRNELFGQDFKDRAIALLEAVVKGVEDPQDRIHHLNNLEKQRKVATKDLGDAKQKLAKKEQLLSTAKADLRDAAENEVAEYQANVDKLTKEIKDLKKSIAYLTAFSKRCEAERPQKDELTLKAQRELAQGRLDVKKAETEFVESFSKQHPAIEWRLLFGELAEQYGSKEEFANIFPVFKDLVTRACAENRKLSPAIADKAREIFQIPADAKRMQDQDAVVWANEELSKLISDLEYKWLTTEDEVEKQDVDAKLTALKEYQSLLENSFGWRENVRRLIEFMSLYAASPKIPVQRETDESVVAGDKLLELRSRVAEALKVASIETIGVMIDRGTKTINEQLEAGQTLTRQKVMECAQDVNLAPMEVVGQLINMMVSIESDSVRDPKLSIQLQKDIRDIGQLLETQRNLAKAESDQVWDQWQKGGNLRRVESDYHTLLKRAAEVFSQPVPGLSFYGGKVREQFAAALLSLCDDNGLRVAFADAQAKGFEVVHKAMDKLDSQPRVQESAVEDRDLADQNVGQKSVRDIRIKLDARHEESWPKEGEEIPPGFSLAHVAYQNFLDNIRAVEDKDLTTINAAVLRDPFVKARNGFDMIVKDAAGTLETLNGKSAGEFVSLVDQQFLAPIERRLCEAFGFSEFGECPEESITTAVDGIRKTLKAIAAADPNTLEEKKKQLQGQCSVLLEALKTAAGNMKKYLNSDLDIIADATVTKESSWASLEQSLERVKTKFSDLLSSNMRARVDMEAFDRLVGQVKDGVFGFTEKHSELSEKFQSMLEDIKDVAQWFDSRELYEEFLGLRRQFDDCVADYDVVAQHAGAGGGLQ